MIRINTNFISVCLVPTVQVGTGKFSTQNFYRCNANCFLRKCSQFGQIASALSAASTNVIDKKLSLVDVISAFDSVFAEVLRNSLLERSALPFSQWARQSEENGNYDVIHCLLLRSAMWEGTWYSCGVK